MTSDRPGRGLWGRVKDALGMSKDGGDLDQRPQVTSTFTASRLPSGDTPALGSRLFPDDEDEGSDDDKWELYQDRWTQDQDAPPADDQDAPPAGDQPAPEEPAAAEVAPPTVAAEPGPPSVDEGWQSPSFEPLSETGAFSPNRAEDLSAALAALAGDDDPAVLEHLDERDVDALARAVGMDEPAADDELPPAPPPPVVEAAPSAGPQEAPAERNLFADPPRTAPIGAPEAQPAPDASGPPHQEPRPVPAAQVDAPAAAAPTQDDTAPSHPVDPAETQLPPVPETDATPTAPQTSPDPPRVAVHEEQIEQAAGGRARLTEPPSVRVHDERIDAPAPPVAMNPSEALAMVERGRPLGPRDDVGPAS